MKVRDFISLSRMKPMIIRGNEPIETVVERFSKQPELRGIFVVNDEEEFIGVITRYELLQWVKYKLISNIEVTYQWKIISDLKKYVFSTNASELTNRYSSKAHLNMDDPIEKALQKMTEFNLIDIPILDSNGKIIGDIKLSDLINKIIYNEE